jgi:hypothetical protein
MPGYTDKSREYLRYAVQHEARAIGADNPKLSKIFLQIANEYRKLARQLDAPWEPSQSFVIGAKVGTVQPEAHRCLTMLGRYGISGWPGIANRAPR